MEQKDKELLLKDLCARLPYNVWVSYKTKYDDIERATILNGNYVRDIMEGTSSWIDFKPYLRPLSSMTEEEKDYVVKHSLGYTANIGGGKKDEKLYFHFKAESYDWLNKKMFDYRGLIPKDLALSTEEFSPYNKD